MVSYRIFIMLRISVSLEHEREGEASNERAITRRPLLHSYSARHTAIGRRGAWAGDWREIEIGREIDGRTWHVLCYPGGQAAAPQLPGRGVEVWWWW